MKNALLVAIALMATGCNQSSSLGKVDATAEGGWTDTNRATVQSSCEQAASQAYTRDRAVTYCSCIFERIEPRWTYSELQQKEAAIIEALSKEGTLSRCLQAANPQSDDLALTAKAAGMPDGFFGVRLNSSVEDVKAVRPNVQEISGTLKEVVEWNGKIYNVSYEVSQLSNQIIFISLERVSSEASYLITNSELNSEFGPLSSPEQDGLWVLKSGRVAGGVKLTHGLSDDSVPKEKIMLSVAYD